jgi:hypothetical protein
MRVQGGPVRHTSHPWIGPVAATANRLGLRRLAMRLWAWGGFYIVGEHGPEEFR